MSNKGAKLISVIELVKLVPPATRSVESKRRLGIAAIPEEMAIHVRVKMVFHFSHWSSSLLPCLASSGSLFCFLLFGTLEYTGSANVIYLSEHP